ncbi:phospholipase/carboxylesterase [Gemmatirosa kalamazoonensis]|uniref:Phospholipase/carboxylesterase n=1 Tax=Gemmatirosa kalamazoonensis TaxID=861299 RepID=W0RCN3_9BACT|nr:alpha/beta hydrolase-fold protein [Gemmatirosa kalamazoonensis]AHG88869.1 phospholipase/carboxylesterase [Gemmatirosa kalamazoonensis]
MHRSSTCTRRDFVRFGALGAASLAGTSLGACRLFEPKTSSGDSPAAHLVSRPGAATGARGPLTPGLEPLDVDTSQEVLLYVPTGYTPDRPAPLAVALHGAGQSARTGITPLMAQADAVGLIVVAPQSVGSTWDFIRGTYGPDVANMDKALARVFRDANVDPARIALTGFSDGASYALSLGLTNGDLFTRLVAFSPCILSPAARRGKPSIFVSHGTRDGVLPIDSCSRRFVPSLRADGYAVTYREFDGPHMVPSAIAAEAAAFIMRA